jgi:hypothetical protein
MKIRIKSNSVRFRLTLSDVKILSETGYLEEKVDFGDQSLSYAITITAGGKLLSAFKNDTISLFMPGHMITELQDTGKVGFENVEGPVHLLVEKDFTCLDNVTEDQSDNYPNPLAEKYDEGGD